jgi:hypothetical protein
MSWRQLFSGSRFIFWALAPFLIVGALVFSLSVDCTSPIRVALVPVLDSLALLLALGLCCPSRNEWALRLVTGLVFVVYLAYLVEENGRASPCVLSEAAGKNRSECVSGVHSDWLPVHKVTLLGFDGWRHKDELDEQTDPDPFRADDSQSGDLE